MDIGLLAAMMRRNSSALHSIGDASSQAVQSARA
jgi:hypothetical protein